MWMRDESLDVDESMNMDESLDVDGSLCEPCGV